MAETSLIWSHIWLFKILFILSLVNKILILPYSSLLKYVPTNHFKYIVKDVRRQRCREEEESVWASFVKQQELNGYGKNGIHTSVQSIKQLLDEGMREADKELKKLETDIMPDRMRKEYSKTANNQKRKPKVCEFSIYENILI